MTLRDAIATLDALSEDCILFAKVPWSLDCEVSLVQAETIETTQPVDGFAYFLEVFVAKELLEDNTDLTIHDKAMLLIRYATYDA